MKKAFKDNSFFNNSFINNPSKENPSESPSKEGSFEEKNLEEKTFKEKSFEEKAFKEPPLEEKTSKEILSGGNSFKEPLSRGNLFLIGFMGAGKSTVADCLHVLYGMDVVEMDREIEEQEGMGIPDIFEKYGEEYFRSAETGLLSGLQGRRNAVISCGGGVPMRKQNVREMKKSGYVVLLTAKPETILQRVQNSHDRPLLENNKTAAFIADMMEKRRANYEAAADIIVETDGRAAPEICREILDRLQAGPGIPKD